MTLGHAPDTENNASYEVIVLPFSHLKHPRFQVDVFLCVLLSFVSISPFFLLHHLRWLMLAAIVVA